MVEGEGEGIVVAARHVLEGDARGEGNAGPATGGWATVGRAASGWVTSDCAASGCATHDPASIRRLARGALAPACFPELKHEAIYKLPQLQSNRKRPAG
jgi:hypothetical protein